MVTIDDCEEGTEPSLFLFRSHFRTIQARLFAHLYVSDYMCMQQLCIYSGSSLKRLLLGTEQNQLISTMASSSVVAVLAIVCYSY